ncbi:hypothetical protein BH23CHL2_BH23CHL2_21890 [soil metagenome]
MQAPTTMTRGNGFNRLTAGAIGLALLAASTIGAISLNDRVDLPLIGGNSQTQTRVAQNPVTEMLLVEQNSFDYAAVAPADPLFLEENSWDYQPAANYASAASIRLIENNSFDYATPVTTQQIAFLEANSWDYPAQAEPAGDATAAESTQDFRFLEENLWENQGQMIPPANTGNTDY